MDMPSGEEYLDQLLKGIEEPVLQDPVFDVSETNEDILKKMVLENATIEDVLMDDIAMNMDDVEDDSIMSVDEIEQILAANQMEVLDADDWSGATLGEDAANEDLMSLLEESSDSELQDIYDMLHKSDNNEVVDEDMLALLKNISDTDEVAMLQAELDAMEEGVINTQEGVSEKQRKAEEKKRLKAEKAEAKRAAKEAKKAEKESKRAARKATKEIAKENEEAAAGSVSVAESVGNEESDVFEGIGDLSTSDMMDLQDLLAFGDMQTPSDAAIAELQQGVQVQSRPKMVDVPEESSAPEIVELDQSMTEDMLEIDELLTLAGISSESVESIPTVDLTEGITTIDFEDEDALSDIIPEKKTEKKGLFARILDFLTETDDEDEEKGTEDIPLSDENRSILEEMDKEERPAGKKGKKAKKSKKDKNAKVELETLDEDGEDEKPSKNKKSKKEKKSKKAKEEHLKVMPLEDSKNKLSVKKILPVAAVCVSILAVILLIANLGGDFAVKREAKKAYYQEDYETCYQTLYGKELNESEQVMFARSESILRINLRMKEYELFAGEGSEVEALDVLIQTVMDYEELYAYASKWNADQDVATVYGQMLNILQDKYGLTEENALEIAAEPDDVEYTRLVTAAAGGEGYRPSNEGVTAPDSLPDMLPEEKQFPENSGGR